MSPSAAAGLVVRSIRSDDVAGIIRVDRLVGGSRPPSVWRGLLETYADPESDDSERLNATLCQVAFLDGKVVGFILGDIQSWQFGIERCGRIVAIAVDPAHSREDIGTALVESLCDVFRARELPFVQCLARPGEPLHGFFSANRFRRAELEVLELDLERRRAT
jgi:ribosomal protein S18 acetylase RimI-like enzyme